MLEGFLDRFKVLAEADENKVLQSIFENETLQAQIIDLNQEQLYEKGVQADGSTTGEYSLRTIAYKEAYGDARQTPGRTDHITGLDTGQTYDSMRVKSKEDEVEITVDDRNGFFKREDKGLGLTDESIEELKPEIIERVIEYFTSTFTD